MSKLIAIDDGHGMETAGKRTPVFTDGTTGETGKPWMHENEFNRAVAEYLRINLERCGFKTIITAPGDSDVPRPQRLLAANKAKAGLFLSVHANALNGVWGEQQGISTYHYPGSKEGQKAATVIHRHLIQGTQQKDRKVLTAKFDVLAYTDMPAVLVECAFMDNLREAKLLLSDAFRRECAEEICKGICEYFNTAYVPVITEPTYEESLQIISEIAGIDPLYWKGKKGIDKYFETLIIKIAKGVKQNE